MRRLKLEHPLYYVPLIFIAFPVLGVLKFDYPFWTIWFTVGFVVSYLYMVHADDNILSILTWIYMLLYIFYMTFTIDVGMIWYNMYLVNLISFKYIDRPVSFRMISLVFTIILTVILMVFYVSDPYAKTISLIVSIMCFMLMYYWKRESERKRQREIILEKNRSINFLIYENERNRIGQDLHDTLGHVFAMLSVKADLANTLLSKGEIDKAQKEIGDLQDISKKSMNDVRKIVESIKDTKVRDEIIILNNMFEIAGINLELSGNELVDKLPNYIQSKLAMVLRELGTNLIKHSKANNCSLNFSMKDKNLILDYEDDGIGFSNINGTELHAIKDRLVTIKGSIYIISNVMPTHIRICIPMEDV